MEISAFGYMIDIEMLLRIVAAAICGGLLGFERNRRRKEAGVRTHMIVALNAALIMLVSKYGFYDVLGHDAVGLDPSRIASNIVTGISFLGAGVIFVKNVSIRGLTTAAGLWATAGIGLAIGAGMYDIGIFATIVILVVQFILHSHLRVLENNIKDEISLTYRRLPESLEGLKRTLKNRNIVIAQIEMEKNDDSTVTVVLTVVRENHVSCSDFSDIFSQDDNIKKFKL